LDVQVFNPDNYLSGEFSAISIPSAANFKVKLQGKKNICRKVFASLENQVSWPKPSPSRSQQLESFST